jgi:drug/metabolite transporter (DMT)-like permease
MLASFLTTVFWAVSAICGARSARIIGGTEANFWRLAAATLMLAAWAYSFGQGLTGGAFATFFVSGLIGIGIGDIAYFQTLPRLGPRLTLLLTQCLTAPLGAALEWMRLGTKLTPAQMFWGFVILCGVGVSLAPGRHLHLAKKAVISGVIWSLLAAVGGAWGAVLSREAFAIADHLGQKIDAPTAAFQRLVGGLLFAGVCLLVVMWRRGKNGGENGSPVMSVGEKWRRAGFWILANSIAGQTIGVSCYQWAIHTTEAGVVLAIVATTPLIAIPFTMLIDGERPSMHSMVGDVVAVVGVIGLSICTLKP